MKGRVACPLQCYGAGAKTCRRIGRHCSSLQFRAQRCSVGLKEATMGWKDKGVKYIFKFSRDFDTRRLDRSSFLEVEINPDADAVE